MTSFQVQKELVGDPTHAMSLHVDELCRIAWPLLVEEKQRSSHAIPSALSRPLPVSRELYDSDTPQTVLESAIENSAHAFQQTSELDTIPTFAGATSYSLRRVLFREAVHSYRKMHGPLPQSTDEESGKPVFWTWPEGIDVVHQSGNQDSTSPPNAQKAAVTAAQTILSSFKTATRSQTGEMRTSDIADEKLASLVDSLVSVAFNSSVAAAVVVQLAIHCAAFSQDHVGFGELYRVLFIASLQQIVTNESQSKAGDEQSAEKYKTFARHVFLPILYVGEWMHFSHRCIQQLGWDVVGSQAPAILSTKGAHECSLASFSLHYRSNLVSRTFHEVQKRKVGPLNNDEVNAQGSRASSGLERDESWQSPTTLGQGDGVAFSDGNETNPSGGEMQSPAAVGAFDVGLDHDDMESDGEEEDEEEDESYPDGFAVDNVEIAEIIDGEGVSFQELLATEALEDSVNFVGEFPESDTLTEDPQAEDSAASTMDRFVTSGSAESSGAMSSTQMEQAGNEESEAGDDASHSTDPPENKVFDHTVALSDFQTTTYNSDKATFTSLSKTEMSGTFEAAKRVIISVQNAGKEYAPQLILAPCTNAQMATRNLNEAYTSAGPSTPVHVSPTVPNADGENAGCDADSALPIRRFDLTGSARHFEVRGPHRVVIFGFEPQPTNEETATSGVIVAADIQVDMEVPLEVNLEEEFRSAYAALNIRVAQELLSSPSVWAGEDSEDAAIAALLCTNGNNWRWNRGITRMLHCKQCSSESRDSGSRPTPPRSLLSKVTSHQVGKASDNASKGAVEPALSFVEELQNADNETIRLKVSCLRTDVQAVRAALVLTAFQCSKTHPGLSWSHPLWGDVIRRVRIASRQIGKNPCATEIVKTLLQLTSPASGRSVGGSTTEGTSTAATSGAYDTPKDAVDNAISLLSQTDWTDVTVREYLRLQLHVADARMTALSLLEKMRTWASVPQMVVLANTLKKFLETTSETHSFLGEGGEVASSLRKKVLALIDVYFLRLRIVVAQTKHKDSQITKPHRYLTDGTDYGILVLAGASLLASFKRMTDVSMDQRGFLNQLTPFLPGFSDMTRSASFVIEDRAEGTYIAHLEALLGDTSEGIAGGDVLKSFDDGAEESDLTPTTGEEMRKNVSELAEYTNTLVGGNRGSDGEWTNNASLAICYSRHPVFVAQRGSSIAQQLGCQLKLITGVPTDFFVCLAPPDLFRLPLNSLVRSGSGAIAYDARGSLFVNNWVHPCPPLAKGDALLFLPRFSTADLKWTLVVSLNNVELGSFPLPSHDLTLCVHVSDMYAWNAQTSFRVKFLRLSAAAVAAGTATPRQEALDSLSLVAVSPTPQYVASYAQLTFHLLVLRAVGDLKKLQAKSLGETRLAKRYSGACSCDLMSPLSPMNLETHGKEISGSARGNRFGADVATSQLGPRSAAPHSKSFAQIQRLTTVVDMCAELVVANITAVITMLEKTKAQSSSTGLVDTDDATVRVKRRAAKMIYMYVLTGYLSTAYSVIDVASTPVNLLNVLSDVLCCQDVDLGLRLRTLKELGSTLWTLMNGHGLANFDPHRLWDAVRQLASAPQRSAHYTYHPFFSPSTVSSGLRLRGGGSMVEHKDTSGATPATDSSQDDESNQAAAVMMALLEGHVSGLARSSALLSNQEALLAHLLMHRRQASSSSSRYAAFASNGIPMDGSLGDVVSFSVRLCRSYFASTLGRFYYVGLSPKPAREQQSILRDYIDGQLSKTSYMLPDYFSETSDTLDKDALHLHRANWFKPEEKVVYGSGDVITVIVNVKTRTIAFARNGLPLGTLFSRFTDPPGGMLYPCVGLYNQSASATFMYNPSLPMIVARQFLRTMLACWGTELSRWLVELVKKGDLASLQLLGSDGDELAALLWPTAGEAGSSPSSGLVRGVRQLQADVEECEASAVYVVVGNRGFGHSEEGGQSGVAATRRTAKDPITPSKRARQQTSSNNSNNNNSEMTMSPALLGATPPSGTIPSAVVLTNDSGMPRGTVLTQPGYPGAMAFTTRLVPTGRIKTVCAVALEQDFPSRLQEPVDLHPYVPSLIRMIVESVRIEGAPPLAGSGAAEAKVLIERPQSVLRGLRLLADMDAQTMASVAGELAPSLRQKFTAALRAVMAAPLQSSPLELGNRIIPSAWKAVLGPLRDASITLSLRVPVEVIQQPKHLHPQSESCKASPETVMAAARRCPSCGKWWHECEAGHRSPGTQCELLHMLLEKNGIDHVYTGWHGEWSADAEAGKAKDPAAQLTTLSIRAASDNSAHVVGEGEDRRGTFTFTGKALSATSVSGKLVYRNISEPKTEVEVNLSEPWDCEACTFHNEGDTTRCAVCLTGRPNATWTCMMCSYRYNPVASNQCTTCGNHRRPQMTLLSTVRGGGDADEHIAYCSECGAVKTFERFFDFVSKQACGKCGCVREFFPKVKRTAIVTAKLNGVGDALEVLSQIDSGKAFLCSMRNCAYSAAQLQETISKTCPTEDISVYVPPLLADYAAADADSNSSSAVLRTSNADEDADEVTEASSASNIEGTSTGSRTSSSGNSTEVTPPQPPPQPSGNPPPPLSLFRRTLRQRLAASDARGSEDAAIQTTSSSGLGETVDDTESAIAEVRDGIVLLASKTLCLWGPLLLGDEFSSEVLLSHMYVEDEWWLRSLVTCPRSVGVAVATNALRLLFAEKCSAPLLHSLSVLCRTCIAVFSDTLHTHTPYLLYALCRSATSNPTSQYRTVAHAEINDMLEREAEALREVLEAPRDLPGGGAAVAVCPKRVNASCLQSVLEMMPAVNGQQRSAVFAKLHGVQVASCSSIVTAMCWLTVGLRRMRQHAPLPACFDCDVSTNLPYLVALPNTHLNDSGELVLGQVRGSVGVEPNRGGCHYYEVVMPSNLSEERKVIMVGWGTKQHEVQGSAYHVGANIHSWAFNCVDRVRVLTADQVVSPPKKIGAGDVIGALLNFDTKMASWSVNGTVLLWVSIPTEEEGGMIYPYVSASVHPQSVVVRLSHTEYKPDDYQDFTVSEKVDALSTDSTAAAPQSFDFYRQLCGLVGELSSCGYSVQSLLESTSWESRGRYIVPQYPLVADFVYGKNSDETRHRAQAEATANAGLNQLEPYFRHLLVLSDLAVLVAKNATVANDSPYLQHVCKEAEKLLFFSARWAINEDLINARVNRTPSVPPVSVDIDVKEAQKVGPVSAPLASKLEKSVCGQLYQQLSNLSIYCNANMFTVHLNNSIAHDVGGVTRSVISMMCDELMYLDDGHGHRTSPPVPLFELCEHSTVFTVVPNTSLLSTHPDQKHRILSMYKWLGKMLGNATLVGTLKYAISLPRLAWKYLVRAPVNIEDYFYDCDDTVRGSLSDEEFLLNDTFYFAIPGMEEHLRRQPAARRAVTSMVAVSAAAALPRSGLRSNAVSQVDLSSLGFMGQDRFDSNGQGDDADGERDTDEIALFVAVRKAVAEQALVHRFDVLLSAMREGLESVLTTNLMERLRWDDLQERVCGISSATAEDVLASMDMTSLSPELQGMVVEVVRTLTDLQRSHLLLFCTGQRRVPVPEKVRVTCGDDRTLMPTAHTCSPISLRLQPYEDTEELRTKLVACLTHIYEFGFA